ncbi:MerR family transcriptional regulator [Wolinella succinogenes]|uniref:MerR family transcriptional regulator n=1 Tax=Wolinella succinogenes TaxID=844 RepID=UPI0002E2F52E|nr:MerR family transcriptional regulator [Wolinella succinogenes]NLU34453.1 MerR family transcriptional regulator [Wolinella succinogenes]
MSIVKKNIPIASLSAVAEILKTKPRTMRMYEERGLLPGGHEKEKKLYSLEEIDRIMLVHYLATHERINANGIRFILKLLDWGITQEAKEALFKEAQELIEKESMAEIKEGDL